MFLWRQIINTKTPFIYHKTYNIFMAGRRGGGLFLLQTIATVVVCILVFISAVDSIEFYNVGEDVVSHHLDVSSYVKPFELKQLNWEFPPGYEPGTFQEYIRHHPYTKAEFKIPSIPKEHQKSSKVDISILVEDSLYQFIEDNLIQYMQDLESLGYNALVELLSGGNPEEVKSWVRDQYEDGASGIVFIGDIPAAWAKVGDQTFPCDLYYMDLDGLWIDSDSDGIYDGHEAGTGDMGPEVYVGRLFVSTLSWASEAGMINDYLEKVHRYRLGELVVPWRGLEYVDEDWYNMEVHLDDIYGKNVSRYDLGYHTTAQDYLGKLEQGQHFVQVCAHSFSGGHHFGTRPTEAVAYANVYVYSPSEREGILLVGSDDGVKVWWNGENVITADVYDKGWSADEYKVHVHLSKGWNRLLCKVSQEGGRYLLSARLTDLSYQPFDDLTYQTSNPLVTGPEAPYIRSWLINGFHQDAPENFYQYLTTNYLGVNESTVVPEEGEEMGGCIWTRVDSGYPYIDLNSYSDNADYGVSYAFTTVYAAQEIHCQLWIGYDDGMRAWLNGEEILFDNRYGGFEPDMEKINVTLSEGENHLLLKVSEWMGEHGFTARFCDEHGNLVEGLSYAFVPKPITYIGAWLVNGVYENRNQSARLNMDYLGNESMVTPVEGDTTVVGKWSRGIGCGYPFDLGGFFDHGDWVFSETIQEVDP
ncbi:MAG TPA: hypothetical protein ENI42_00410, partial [Thermoplasmatales archaeon]|nr:hypothetical protein [Thermoplasmatales archaeon]